MILLCCEDPLSSGTHRSLSMGQRAARWGLHHTMEGRQVLVQDALDILVPLYVCQLCYKGRVSSGRLREGHVCTSGSQPLFCFSGCRIPTDVHTIGTVLSEGSWLLSEGFHFIALFSPLPSTENHCGSEVWQHDCHPGQVQHHPVLSAISPII